MRRRGRTAAAFATLRSSPSTGTRSGGRRSTSAGTSRTGRRLAMGNPVVHFEIMGGDGEKLKGFYADLFGWKIDSNNPMNYGMVDTEAEGSINGGVGDGENLSGTRVYIAAPDLPEALHTLDAAARR